MPELPEVHTIASDLKKHALGYTIKEIQIEEGYNLHPDNNYLTNKICGKTIIQVGRIGKNIIIKTNDSLYLTIHLAMTGRILLKDKKDPKDPWERVCITVTEGSNEKYIKFCDMRMFGKVGILSSKEARALKEKYGPDAVSKEINVENIYSILRGKKTTIKNALLDQTIIAGVGNIYANDALWLSKIRPDTRTSKLSYEQVTTLLENTRKILSEGILHRGSTLPDEAYVDIFGKPGNHQKYFRIYGKSKCPECNESTEFVKLNGRGTYFCPKCQM